MLEPYRLRYPKASGEIYFVYNSRKAVEAVLYILQQCGGRINLYNLHKILYAADKHHLNTQSFTVTGDFYLKEANGVVAIYLTDVLAGRHKQYYLEQMKLEELPLHLTKQGDDYIVTGTREPNTRYLAKTNLAALKKGIKEYAKLSREQVKRKNHKEKCWRETPDNHVIPFELMITDPAILEELEEHPYGIGV